MGIKYPAKVGQTWTVKAEGITMKFKISLLLTKPKTRVGTFKNTLEVYSYFDDSKNYYAANVGHIKSTSDGKTISELVQLKNR